MEAKLEALNQQVLSQSLCCAAGAEICAGVRDGVHAVLGSVRLDRAFSGKITRFRDNGGFFYEEFFENHVRSVTAPTARDHELPPAGDEVMR